VANGPNIFQMLLVIIITIIKYIYIAQNRVMQLMLLSSGTPNMVRYKKNLGCLYYCCDEPNFMAASHL